MRKTFVALFIAMLVSQPAFALGGAFVVLDRVGIATVSAAQPVRGCQYSGTDLTRHVPIFINGTTDFVSQGWPGAGTEASPYLIQKLNITYDVGLVGIRIIETTAYFVIRDCYIKQVSDLECIQLYNTSHAAIEYTTAVSSTDPIVCDYTDNLRIYRTVVTAGTDMAVTINYADNAVLQWNLFSSTSTRGLFARWCDDLRSEHNEYVSGSTGWNSLYLYQCERASSQYDYSYGGYAGLYVSGSENVTISGFEGKSNQIGISAVDAARIALHGCHIANAADHGIQLDSCPNGTVDECVVRLDEGSGFGIYALDSPQVRIAECDVAGASGVGMVLVTSPGSILDDCILTQCGSGESDDGAVFVIMSSDTLVTDNEIRGTDGAGMSIGISDRVIVEHNQIRESSTYGIAMNNCQNTSVTDNELIGAGTTVLYAVFCNRADLLSNVVMDGGGDGIFVQNSDYVKITANTISRVYRGVFLTDASEASLTYNTISETHNGILTSMTTLCDIGWNTIETSLVGIALGSSQDATVANNVILASDPQRQGINVAGSLNITFADNRMTGCGFIFSQSEAEAYYNHTFADNIVNGLPVYYSWSGSGLALVGSSYGQIILVNCEDVTVTSGLFHRNTVAVHAFYCDDIHITGITVEQDIVGLILGGTSNSTLYMSDVDYCTMGVQIYDCDFFTVDQSTVYHAQETGAEIGYSTNVTVEDSRFEYASWGIVAYESPYLNLAATDFRSISEAGVLADFGCFSWNVTECEFFNTTNGIDLRSQYDWHISSSVFTHCGDGIHVTGDEADNGWVIGCDFYSNSRGIFVFGGDSWHVINCTILWSINYGLYLSGTLNPEVHGNTIALSGADNGYSNLVQYWDNGVSRGNLWDDYVPPSPYIISGAGATDRYPSLFMPVEPIIDSPMDVTYPEFSTGNYISWLPYDDYLRDWVVQVDGQTWATGAWRPDRIVVDIDGLSYGQHTVVMTVWDINQNSVTDVVNVDVYDDIPPTVSDLASTEAFFGGLGQVLTWTVSDLHPDNYEILRDGAEVASGGWTTGNITTSLDGLQQGVYEYVVRVYDMDGNFAQDEVTVAVLLDTTAPTIDSPVDVVIVVATVGNYITWTPLDDHPRDYEVSKDGVVVQLDAWAGSRIAFSIDGLDLGTYNFTLTVRDGAGHSASDSVVVRVYPYKGYVPPGFDIALLLIAAGIVGVATVVVVLLYFRRKGK